MMADDARATTPDYSEAKPLLLRGDAADRVALAGNPETQPEVLYYLVDDDDEGVRLAVASNDAAPGLANLKLTEDDADDVRIELARKIGRLLPELKAEKKKKLRELTIQALEKLSEDQLPAVRAALAEAVKTSRDIPKDSVMKLAQDVEAIVAAPILEYSPLLSDADLVELIAAGVTIGALPAIARRHDLGAEVGDAIVATADMPSIAALLHNKSATIRARTLDNVAEEAERFEELHEPVVMRPELSQRAMRRIASFISRSLLEQLSERGGLDNKTRRVLAEAVSERLSEDRDADGKLDADFAEHLARQGKLDDEVLRSALEKNRRSFVIRALALLAGRSDAGVERIMEMQNAKATTALVWEAGLSMRTALMVQQRVAKVAPSQILPARNGVDFPMTPEEMEIQIAHIAD
ncbi:hypothetical protein CVT23_10525 [Minwuia thermotolerans]|uniref:DUF2336 domain-containing protein n=2 Tax=Minwuia thermotolerans TaxID=2056226 RepID=A0A2M9G1A0_9PROT|nr:hypothetical protein CVT23_10525 [Minwuia thermotolerans]